MDNLYTFPINLDANQTNYYWFEQGFTPEELSEIEKLVDNIPYTRGVTQTNVDDSETFKEDSYRKSNIKWIPFSEQHKWSYDKIGWMANEANENMFKFDLYSMPEQIQYTEYYDYEDVTGLPLSCKDVIIYGAAYRMASMIDPGRLTLTAPEADIQSNKIPLNAGTNAARYLLALYTQRLDEESRKLRDRYPIRVHYTR